jgi:hypothetical protein
VSRGKRQQFPRVGHMAVFADDASYQAQSREKPREWFLKGLERFVNADDSVEDYNALGRAFPSFWPLPLQNGDGTDLSWVPEGHKLFLFYRDILRRFWARDRATLKDGFQSALLWGNVPSRAWEQILDGTTCDGYHMPLLDALAPLRCVYGQIVFFNSLLPLSDFSPDWNAGAINFTSMLDFQRAVWLLFRQSWRAKVCQKCGTYFLVRKPAQLYCSLSCSNAVHRASSLNWWKAKGARKRAQRKTQ